jgi:diaminohydroxyphosphoribosylaminopyrimidine deaminase/5-amino-6-(5-phosphoribosylamino)uracil reductase
VERLELDPCTPLTVLEVLAQRGCNQVLWECGPSLAAEALKQGGIQQLAAVIAPKLLGGLAARTPLGDLGLVDVNEAQQGDGQGLERLGVDWLWQMGLPLVDELG